MSDPVELMGSGVRIGEAIVLVCDLDDECVVNMGDAHGSASITLPPHAARHLAERLLLKAAEVERAAAYPADAAPLVPRRIADPNPRG